MKKLFLARILLIVLFALFAIGITTYTLLDAFVLDRMIFDPETSITVNPTFTLMPSKPKPSTPKETTAQGTPESNLPAVTDGTSTPVTTPSNSPITTQGKTPETTPSVIPNTTAKTPDLTLPQTTAPGHPEQTTPKTTAQDTLPNTPPTTTEEEPIVTTPEVTTEAKPVITYPIIEDRYYKDENIEITIDEKTFYREYKNDTVETRYFVIDLKLTDIEYLRTHFLNHNGVVIKATTSDLAEDVGAIFAINGDYFSFRSAGFVIRNYTPFRDTARSLHKTEHNGDDALFILPDGSFMMLDENDPMFKNGLPSGVYQCFSFGPRLIENDIIMVDEDSEVGQSSSRGNPRTAIGIVEPLHYKIVVAEGRLVDGDGLSLLEVAKILKNNGCESAYNLDGGSSTTLYFNGEVINTPGRDDGSERKISDIIYINGYTHSEEN